MKKYEKQNKNTQNYKTKKNKTNAKREKQINKPRLLHYFFLCFVYLNFQNMNLNYLFLIYK